MCNVWFLILFFISCFSCTICVLLCALCVDKDCQIHSNASVVFCGGISAGRYTEDRFAILVRGYAIDWDSQLMCLSMFLSLPDAPSLSWPMISFISV